MKNKLFYFILLLSLVSTQAQGQTKSLLDRLFDNPSDSAQNHSLEECPDLSTGDYRITHLEPILQTFPVTNEDWEPTSLEYTGNAKPKIFGEIEENTFIKLTLEDSSGLTINLGSGVDFKVDGKPHFISKNKKLDGYFQKYTSYCSDGYLIIEESGTNNNSQFKQNDHYEGKLLLNVSETDSSKLEVLYAGTTFFKKTEFKARTETLILEASKRD